MVVSHNADSATKSADRIIELKDEVIVEDSVVNKTSYVITLIMEYFQKGLIYGKIRKNSKRIKRVGNQ